MWEWLILAAIVVIAISAIGAMGCLTDPIGCLLGTDTVTSAEYGVMAPLGASDGPQCEPPNEYYGGVCYKPCVNPNNRSEKWVRTAAITCAREGGKSIGDCEMSQSVIPGCEGTDWGGICYKNDCPVIQGVKGQPRSIHSCNWGGDFKMWTDPAFTSQEAVDRDPRIKAAGGVWLFDIGWTAVRGRDMVNFAWNNNTMNRNVCPASHPNLHLGLCYRDWKKVLVDKHKVTDINNWKFDGACVATNVAVHTDADLYGSVGVPTFCKDGDYYGSACYRKPCSALDGTDGKGGASPGTGWERAAVMTCAKKKSKFEPRNYLSWEV